MPLDLFVPLLNVAPFSASITHVFNWVLRMGAGAWLMRNDAKSVPLTTPISSTGSRLLPWSSWAGTCWASSISTSLTQGRVVQREKAQREP